MIGSSGEVRQHLTRISRMGRGLGIEESGDRVIGSSGHRVIGLSKTTPESSGGLSA
jgi:hypothetical protein